MLPEGMMREVVNSIYARGEIPLKYAYLDEGARIWAMISDERLTSESFTLGEIKGVKRILRSFVEEGTYDKISLVDLGCGTGKPAMYIAEFLSKKGIDLSYVPVDISSQLLSMASTLFKKKDYPSTPIHIDFDEHVPTDVKKVRGPRFLLFLGNTLGNHSNDLKILVNIREVMGKDDILFLGFYTYNFMTVRALLKEYENDPHNKEFLYVVPRQLGITEENSHLLYLWNDERKELLAVIEMDKEKRIGSLRLRPGDRIVVGRSVRYTPERIVSLAREAGYKFLGFTEPMDGVGVLALSVRRVV